MKWGKKTVNGASFGDVLLCGERSHGQCPPLKSLRILPEYVMVYLYEGSGTYLDTNEENIELEPGSCLIIPPEIPHIYHPNSANEWSEIFFVFNGAVFDTWQAHGLLPENTEHLTLRPIEYWLPKFRKPLFTDKPRSNTLTNCCHLQLLLSDINSYAGAIQFPEEDLAWLDRAKALIEANIETNPSLTKLANEMQVSYDTFRKRFQKTCGISPSNYRTQIQISHACKLLLETRISITQIAEQLGFYDVFHLSKRFKQATGFSPQQFRKRF